MYDIIGDPKNLDDDAVDEPPCLVLEWIDCTLTQVPSGRHLQNRILIKAIIDAVLSSFVALDKEKLVNTDIKPDNILLSDVDTDHPIVKIGDLGLVRPDGLWHHVQPFAMRAPEVYRGLACVHQSQVWAVAATLLCWIKPGVIGTAGCPGSLYREGW
ncbi:hypothetical protein MMC17_005556 [Xylographa soralifera]|nr:hypothetical protein [Xylographa soralifera]